MRELDLNDPLAAARIALSCLDLTSLNDGDGEADIRALCSRAQGPLGPVAAVCVWPRFAALARGELPTGIAVAAVANFPEGGDDLGRALRDTDTIAQAGAQEVDLVLPYAQLMSGQDALVARFVEQVRAASTGLRLKVILETGVLREPAWVGPASRIALDAGADFIKTSTGKTPVGATVSAARTMLQTIADHPVASRRAGFKVSGGVRTVADAQTYLQATAGILGPAALVPARFRIGASGLLNDIESVLSGRGPNEGTRAAPGY